MGKEYASSEGDTAVISNAQRQKRGSVWLGNRLRVAKLVGDGAWIRTQSLESFPSASQSAEQTSFGSDEGGCVRLGDGWPRDLGLAPHNCNLFN